MPILAYSQGAWPNHTSMQMVPEGVRRTLRPTQWWRLSRQAEQADLLVLAIPDPASSVTSVQMLISCLATRRQWTGAHNLTRPNNPGYSADKQPPTPLFSISGKTRKLQKRHNKQRVMQMDLVRSLHHPALQAKDSHPRHQHTAIPHLVFSNLFLQGCQACLVVAMDIVIQPLKIRTAMAVSPRRPPSSQLLLLECRQ